MDGKMLATRALKALETADLAEFEAVMAEDYVQHNHLGNGREPVKKMSTALLKAFPDLIVTIEDMIAEGDRVVARITMVGTHQGRFQGVEPTGKRIEFRAIDIWRVEDGRLKEHWDMADRFGVMRQLGLIGG